MLAELKKRSGEGMARQIQYIMKQFDKADTQEDDEEDQSDEEEEPAGNNENGTEEEDGSDRSEAEIDKDIVSRGIPTGESLLMSEFGVTQESKDYDSSSQQPIVENEKESDRDDEVRETPAKETLREEIKNPEEPQISPLAARLPTPAVFPEKRPQRELGPERVPSAMQSRPKIPRTPIPSEKLEQVKKENAMIRQNAVHVYVNESANLKKQKIVHPQHGGIPKYGERVGYSREEESAGLEQQVGKTNRLHE